MADRYAVAAGNWNDTATWSDTSGGAPGFSVPTTADNAFFDANSPAGTYTVNVSSACLDLDFTGFTGTFAGSSALEIRGSLTLAAGMTLTYTGTITFTATDARTITSNGVVLNSSLTFNGVGGTWTLQDNLTTGANRLATLTTGTLALGAFDAGAGRWSTSNANSRAITGSGNIISITTTNGSIVWDSGTSANLDLSAWTGTLVLDNNAVGSSTMTVDGGLVSLPAVSVIDGLPTYVMNSVVCTSYTQTSDYGGSLTIGTNGLTAGSFTLNAANGTPNASATGLTINATGTIDMAGKVTDFPVTVDAPGGTVTLADNLTSGATRALTLTAGTLDLDTFDATFGTLSMSGSTARAISGTGDIILANASGTTTVVSAAVMDNLTLSGWSGGIRLTGANSSARTIACDASPSVTLPPISVEAGSGGVTLTNVVCASYTQTSGYTGILTLGTGGLTTGSFTLDAVNGTPAASATGLTINATGTIDTAGKLLDTPVTINATGGTVTLGAALDIQARELTLANGTFDQAAQAITCGSCVVNGTAVALASDFDIGTAPLTFTAGTFDADANDIDAGSVAATGSDTRVIDLSGSTVTLANTGTAWDATGTNVTLTTTGSTIVCADPDVTFAGGSRTYNIVEFARGGDIVITGSNTFHTLRLNP